MKFQDVINEFKKKLETITLVGKVSSLWEDGRNYFMGTLSDDITDVIFDLGTNLHGVTVGSTVELTGILVGGRIDCHFDVTAVKLLEE